VRLPSLSIILVLLFGCATALEQSQVEDRFRTLFACPSPHVVSEAGGYRAEGCGVTAHFRCFEDARTFGSQNPSAADALFSMALSSDTCVLEHSARAPRAKGDRAVERFRANDGVVRLKARAMIRGGHVEAMAIPSRDSEHVILAVHSIGDLGRGPRPTCFAMVMPCLSCKCSAGATMKCAWP
jgi:hypothetical protein